MKIKETECEENFIKDGSIVTQPTQTSTTIARTTTTLSTTELPVISSELRSTTHIPVNIEETKSLDNINNIPQEVLQSNNNVNGLSTTAIATVFNTTETTTETTTKTTTETTTTASTIKKNKTTALSSSSSSLSALSSSEVTTDSTATNKLHPGTLSSKAVSEKSAKKAMATATATASNASNHLTTSSDNVSKNDIGVLDFTINSSQASSTSGGVSTVSTTTTCSSSSSLVGGVAAVPVSSVNNNNNNLKATKTSNCFSNCSNDINRTSSSSTSINHNGASNNYGGRLQFFKDGKFILELARSKEGDKGGWVSVPRKLFRTPAAATLATVMPTSAALVAYPKNENSTSLSFSDDNSSIQSSPWQRDHSWKQIAPRKNISKEMSLYYYHPKHVSLNNYGTKMTKKKCRNPYERSLAKEEFYQTIVTETNCTDKDIKKEDNDRITNHSVSEEINLINTTSIKVEKNENSSSNSEEEAVKNNKDEEIIKDNIPIDSDVTMKSNESLNNIATSQISNGNIKEEPETDDEVKENPSKPIKVLSENKRNTKMKTRAKLNVVIQKLIDNMPARVAKLSKTSVANGASSTNNSTTSLSHTKVSPPSSASRLVEYHQQHVSPRKRILREFEKVSLEDNPSGAGGKRSRAKSSLNSAPTTTQFQNSRSPTNRNNLTSPSSSMGSSSTTNGSSSKVKTMNSTPTQPTRLNSSYSIHSLLSNNNTSNTNAINNCPSSSRKTIEHNVIVNSVGTHQNSVHYPDPKTYQNATLISPKSPENSNHNHYNIGGKSPSQSSFKRRSPPYASPLHEAHSRSPIVTHNNQSNNNSNNNNNNCNTSNEYNRSHSPRSSPAHLQSSANRKMLYANEPSSTGLSHSPSTHHLIQQQSNQNFYSPYMLSSPTSANNSSISPTNGSLGLSRSPRHSSAFAPTSTISNIPSNNTTTSSNRDISPPRPTNDLNREASTPRTVPKKTASIRRQFASPTASTTSSCPSPNERTIEESLNNTSSNYHDRKTPVSSIQNQHMLQRSSPNASTVPPHSSGGVSSPHSYYMYPHGTAINGTANPMHHMVNPNTSAAVAAAAAAYSVPPMLSPSNYYNPYLMTFAALRQNPIWLHQYQAAAGVPLSAAAASRLSSPFHNFPYNGVNHAVVAVATAAGLSLPSHSSVPLSHLQQAAHAQQQQHLLNSAAYHNNTHSLAARLNTEHSTKTTDSIEHSTTKNTHLATSGSRQQQLHPPQHQTQQQQQHHHQQPQHSQQPPTSLSSVTPSNLSSSSSRYSVDGNSIKEHEQSSDVPLNLSKH